MPIKNVTDETVEALADIAYRAHLAGDTPTSIRYAREAVALAGRIPAASRAPFTAVLASYLTPDDLTPDDLDGAPDA